jgi:hypothetical protein
MKTISMTSIALILGLLAPIVRAEDSTGAKCEMCEMMKKKGAAQELAVSHSELEKLVVEMNGSLGSKKVEAMAAVLNRLVEQYKAAPEATAAEPKPAGEGHQH